MNNSTEALIESVRNRYRDYLAQAESTRKGRLTRLMARASDLNDGVEPVVGIDGRLHAPHDHYHWAWSVTDNNGFVVSEHKTVAMGGEFLPTGEPQSGRDGSNTSRITYVPAELAQEIVEALQDDLSIEHGAIFDGRDGQACHLYVDTACTDVVGMITDHVEAPQKAAAAEREAIRQAEHDAAEDVPEGRVEIAGVIVSTRVDDGIYGLVTKMLVRDDRGFKLWGTLPASLEDAETGSHVSFTATVTPSGDDRKFGFFKRPAKGVINEE